MIRDIMPPCDTATTIHRVLMTFSGFNPGDTRSLAARMATEEREAKQSVLSNRQFASALVVIILALAVLGLLLPLL